MINVIMYYVLYTAGSRSIRIPNTGQSGSRTDLRINTPLYLETYFPVDPPNNNRYKRILISSSW